MQPGRFEPRVGGLAIVGVGGHARVVGDTAALYEAWLSIDYFYDRRAPDIARWPERPGWRMAGPVNVLLEDAAGYTAIFVAMGRNEERLRYCDEVLEAGGALATIVHPAAVVSPEASIGPGSVVMAGCVINAGARLGSACIVNTGATIDHDCILGRGVHVGPGVNLGGAVQVGEGSWLGIGACVRELIVIGRGVTVGAGAVVVKPLADGVLAYGNPARLPG